MFTKIRMITKIKFGRTIIGLGKEIFFDSFSVLIQLSLVFDQHFSFEYFHNCSDHRVITRSMFGLTGIDVVKVEKTRPCLKVGRLRSRRVHPICSRLKRDSGAPLYFSADFRPPAIMQLFIMLVYT